MERSARCAVVARIIELLLLLLGTGIAFYITRNSLLYTGRNTWQVERVILSHDTVWKKLVLIMVMLGVLAIFDRLIQPKSAGVKWIRILALAYVFGACVLWIYRLQMPLIPDDSGICYSTAWQIYQKEYTNLMPLGYLVRCPHQLGICVFDYWIFRIFGVGAFRPFYYFNGLMILLCVYAGDRLMQRLQEGMDTVLPELLWLLFSCLNMPAFLYVNYLYGEVMSYSTMVIIAWMVYEFVRTEKLPWAIGTLPFIALAVLLRKNTVILVVAVVILLLGVAVWKWSWKPLLLALCLVLSATLPNKLLHKYYEAVSGYPESPGMPTSLFIAMGLQDEWIGPGWYTDYDCVVFADSGEDVAASDAIGKAYIRERLEQFKADPHMAWDFFSRKITTQWAEPSYDTMFICLETESPDPKVQTFIAELKEGTYTEWFWRYCNTYQAIVYVGFAFYTLYSLIVCLKALLLYQRKKQKAGQEKNRTEGYQVEEDPIERRLRIAEIPTDMAAYIPLLTIIGGFFFSIIWEAKSRYIVEYLVLMLPLSALGYTYIVRALQSLLPIIRRKIEDRASTV